jgi:hypothetical protein
LGACGRRFKSAHPDTISNRRQNPAVDSIQRNQAGYQKMKSSNKIDGVVDAVRFNPDGLVACVRVYQRLGNTFSDRVLMSRDQFIELLRKDKRFCFGPRKENWGFTFDSSVDIQLVKENGQEFIRSAAGSGTGDNLKGVPFF